CLRTGSTAARAAYRRTAGQDLKSPRRAVILLEALRTRFKVVLRPRTACSGDTRFILMRVLSAEPRAEEEHARDHVGRVVPLTEVRGRPGASGEGDVGGRVG